MVEKVFPGDVGIGMDAAAILGVRYHPGCDMSCGGEPGVGCSCRGSGIISNPYRLNSAGNDDE